MKKILIASAVAAVATAALAPTHPPTATFHVLLKVVSPCTVPAGAGSNINFGDVDSNAADVAKSSSISVTCSKKTPYTVGLKSTNNASTAGAGTMLAQTGGNADTVAYQLYSDANYTSVWGSTNTSGTVAGNGVGGVGNGSAQVIPVYAKVLSAALNVTPDNYKDTVTVTVRY